MCNFGYNIHRFGYTHVPAPAEFYSIKKAKQ